MEKQITGQIMGVVLNTSLNPNFIFNQIFEPFLIDIEELLDLGFEEKKARTMIQLIRVTLESRFGGLVRNNFWETIKSLVFYLPNVLLDIEEVVIYGSTNDSQRVGFFMRWAQRSFENGISSFFAGLLESGSIEECECNEDHDFSIQAYKQRIGVSMCPKCHNIGYRLKEEVSDHADTAE